MSRFRERHDPVARLLVVFVGASIWWSNHGCMT
jgi:hypothetical protein